MQRILKAWEPQYVKRNTIIQIVIFALTFIAMVSIWPLQSYHNHDWVKQQAFEPKKDQICGESFGMDDKKLQMISFTKDHIYQMRIYLNAYEFDNKDLVYFRLYDENFSCIYHEEFGCNLIDRDGYVQPKIDMDVAAGRTYYYEIIVPQKASFWWMYHVRIGVPTAPAAELAQAENGTLYIDGIINNEQALVADFDYGTPLAWWQILILEFLVAALGLSVYVIFMSALEWADHSSKQKEKTVKIIFMIAMTAALAVYLIVTLFTPVFSRHISDRITFAFGGSVGALLLFYVIKLPKNEKKRTVYRTKNGDEVSNGTMISLIWRNAIQIVSFGLLFYALSMYVNADVEYLHTNNTRWMLIFMGLALLAVPAPKIFYNKVIYGWLGISGIGAVIYSLSHEPGQERYLAKLTAGVVIIWGLVILQIIFRKRKKIWKHIDKPFLFLWIAFVICTYVFRYEKTWVFTASLPFFAVLLYDFGPEEKRRFLRNFAQGVLFSFWVMTFYNLMHRPYHFWLYYRYGGIFHTVACTGLYLAVVIGVAFALILEKWKNHTEKKGIALYELFTLATAANYVVFSMSRTALLAIILDMTAVMLLSMWIYRKKFLTACKEASIILAMILVCFPLVFSAQRIVPAIVNQPEYYRIEDHNREFAIHEGEPVNSEKYMTIERLFDMFTGRIKNGDASTGLDAKADEAVEKDLIVSVNPTHLPVVEKAADDEGTTTETADFSNGRFDIFKLYLSKVSLKGNPGTVLESPDGESFAHAHNSYIMIFYNFGIIGGILFLVLNIRMLVKAVLFACKNGMKQGAALVPISVIIVFGMTGLTEWTFHPCFTPGFAFLLMIPLLVQQEEKR